MRVFAIALLLAGTPAAAAKQFDLVCVAEGVNERFRVDLDRGEWCFGECKLVQKIASETPGMIVLAEHQPAFHNDRTSYNRINRVTGEWRWFNLDPRYRSIMDHRGTCEPAPFSGMLSGTPKF